jgi:hypothetical protein
VGRRPRRSSCELGGWDSPKFRRSREGALLVAPLAGRVSDAELFPGHARSACIRVEKYSGWPFAAQRPP